MPSAHFDDFAPEVVEPEPTEQAEALLGELSSDDAQQDGQPATQ